MKLSGNVSSYLIKHKKVLILLAAVVLSLVIMYHILPHVFQKKTDKKEYPVDYVLSYNDVMNRVAPKKEGFENVTTTTPAVTLSASQLALCPTMQSTTISAVRSLYSGATFKLEAIMPSKPNEVFICGPGNFVIELVNNASNSLKLAVKDSSGKNTLQKFLKVELPNPTDLNSKCVVLNAFGTSLFIQYEHEHLSLRPLNSSGKPFLGQCFVNYDATEDEIESHALAIGISKVGMDGSELINSGITGNVNVPDATNDGLTSSNTLQAEADKKYADALKGVMDSISALSNQLKGESVSSSVFGNKDAIKINVDLSDSSKSGFADVSKFQDIASSGSGTATVSQLLDQYLGRSGNLELGNIPALSGSLSNNGLLEIKKALQNKFKGCPALDRNLYYTERQLAQCSGCNPDEFLRGQLGGLPKMQ
jgi:hypothetical protein